MRIGRLSGCNRLLSLAIVLQAMPISPRVARGLAVTAAMWWGALLLLGTAQKGPSAQRLHATVRPWGPNGATAGLRDLLPPRNPHALPRVAVTAPSAALRATAHPDPRVTYDGTVNLHQYRPWTHADAVPGPRHPRPDSQAGPAAAKSTIVQHAAWGAGVCASATGLVLALALRQLWTGRRGATTPRADVVAMAAVHGLEPAATALRMAADQEAAFQVGFALFSLVHLGALYLGVCISSSV